jgi:ABC-2 type transport system ATP-binding protein
VATRHCAKLSKGYRQRVGLAQALLHNPDVLILDEPTAGLDPKQIIETRRLIKELGGEHTVILSTHILPEVSQTCQRVVIINRGRVVAVDTPDNLTSRLQGAGTLYVEVDSMGADARATLSAIPGVTGVSISDTRGAATGFEVATAPDRDVRRELASTIVGRGWGLLELRPMRMSLEEVFLKVTTREADSTEVAATAAEAEAPRG